MDKYIIDLAIKAKQASRKMNSISTEVKNNALIAMSKALINDKEKIIQANKLDISNGKSKKLSDAMLDRLLIDEKRILNMADGIINIASLPDPVGEGNRTWRRPNGIQINEIRVPLGVIGMIYESRPNVTVDAAALCIKAGNSVILRGGSEAINTNKILAEIISKAGISEGIPEGSITLIDQTDREIVNKMIKLNEYVDVIIPRGGLGLKKAVIENATVPVIETGAGLCHIYVDSDADIDMAENIIVNAKTQRPGVCNAVETVLVHKDIAKEILPRVYNNLIGLNTEIRVCSIGKKILPQANDATDEDWSKEYLNLTLSIKVVDSIDEAIDHIYKYSTKHSEAIISNNYTNAQKFLKEIDSSAVYVNASTRFTDGSEFGFGAEIGISTQKLHARGPMGLRELTTTKYIIYGDGQIR